MSDSNELAEELVAHPNWLWVDGMQRLGAQGPIGRYPDATEGLPDLSDFPTGGALMGVIDALGVLVDVAREDDGFIVAVETSEGLKGWLGDTLGEAAGWALIEVWADQAAHAS
jgi:hypothetical protein